MKILLNTIIFFIFSLNAASSQLSFDFYAFYNWNKIVDISLKQGFKLGIRFEEPIISNLTIH